MSAHTKPVAVAVNIGDQLTTISCGHVVVELIKFLAYQRLQIPFTYQWLKEIVNMKNNQTNEKRISLQAERHFRVASSALENLDFIIKSLLQEINGSSVPEEVCIALGSTPVTCREIYRLLLPTLCHKPQCLSKNIASDQKIKQNVLRSLVMCEKLSQVFFNPLQPTNTYVFIKRRSIHHDAVSDTFIQYGGCRLPRTSKIVVIDLRTQNKDNVRCCNDYQVFGDVTNENVDCPKESNVIDNETDEFNEIQSNDESTWYQSVYVMKGFKDTIVNGASVTNQWIDS